MNTEIYQFTLSIVGFLFVLMLGIIGFFLKKQVDATESLEKTTKTLEITVSSLQANQTNADRNWEIRHGVIDRRLNAHSERLNEHSEALVELRAKKTISRRSSKTESD